MPRGYGTTQRLGLRGKARVSFQGSVIKRGPGAETYESLDYDRCENAIYRKELREKYENAKAIGKYNRARWVMTLLIGASVAVVAFGITQAQEQLLDFKFKLVSHAFGRATGGFPTWALAALVLINCSFAVAASVFSYMEPAAAGSGIPEIKCYLNGVKTNHVVRLKTLVCKVVGVIFSTSSGLAIGKEGPIIHSGGIVAAGISQAKSTTFPRFNAHVAMFRNDRAKRDFVTCGTAAGVAAAFGAPIGGVMLALEEGASFWNQELTWRTFFCAMCGTFTYNLLASGASGRWGDLSYPGLVSFGVFQTECRGQPERECDALVWRLSDLIFFVAMAALAGLLGAVFNLINEALAVFRLKYLSRRPALRVVEVFVVTALTTIAMLAASMYLGRCRPMKDGQSAGVGYFCAKGEWNDMATLTYSGPENAVRTLFHLTEPFSLPTLATFYAIYFLAACFACGLFLPSGVFLPPLLLGAVLGRLVAGGLQWATDTVGWDHTFHYGAYAVIGAASMLAGVVRMTLSLTVVVIETTSNVSFGLPIMICLVVAKWVGDYFSEGIYDMAIGIRHIPYLSWEPPREMMTFYAAQVMSRDILCFEEVVTVDEVVRVLRCADHSAYPVVGNKHAEANGPLMGIVLRSQLLVLLQRRAWGPRMDTGVDAPILDRDDFIAPYPRFPALDDIVVPRDALGLYMDLSLYMNPCPFTVQQIAPLPRVFNLFRTMGLRHLPVTDRLNNLVGLITRKDLTNLEYRLPSDHDHADHEARHTETASLLGSVSSFGEHDSLISLANSQSLKDMLIAQGDVTGLRALGARALHSASMAPAYARRGSHDAAPPSPLNPIASAPAMDHDDAPHQLPTHQRP